MGGAFGLAPYVKACKRRILRGKILTSPLCSCVMLSNARCKLRPLGRAVLLKFVLCKYLNAHPTTQ
jgi:hypothetical protein